MAQNNISKDIIKKIELKKVRTYFLSVIAKDDYVPAEFNENCKKWQELTGEEFNYDTLNSFYDEFYSEFYSDNNSEELSVSVDEDSMSEDEVMQNATRIDEILSNNRDELNTYGSKNVEILDDNDAPLPAEEASELWNLLFGAAANETAAKLVDDKNFASKPYQNQEDEVKKTFASYLDAFTTDVVRASNQNNQSAVKDFLKGRRVKVYADKVINAVASSVENVERKAKKLSDKGLLQPAKWLNKRVRALSTIAVNISTKLKNKGVKLKNDVKKRFRTIAGTGLIVAMAGLAIWGGCNDNTRNGDVDAQKYTKNIQKHTKDTLNTPKTTSLEKSEADRFAENVKVPTEWSAELGGTQKDWNFVTGVVSGAFSTEKSAKHLKGTKVDARAAFEEAYINIATYMHLHPEAVKDKTPFEVFNNIVRRHAWSLMPENRDADGHLTTIGTFKYAQYDAEMKAWWQIICNGYETKIPVDIDLNAPIKDVTKIGGIKGVKGNKDVWLIGISCGQSAHQKTYRVTKTREVPPAPKPVVEQEPEPDPVEISTIVEYGKVEQPDKHIETNMVGLVVQTSETTSTNGEQDFSNSKTIKNSKKIKTSYRDPIDVGSRKGGRA